MATFPAEVEYSQGTGSRVDLRTLEAQFGDGYRQRSPDGINPTRVSWRVTTVILNITDFEEVETFLKDNAGLYFDWTPPLATEYVSVSCDSYSTQFVGGSEYRRVIAEFVETAK